MLDFLAPIQGNGWVGVALGLVMFGLGWYKGIQLKERAIEAIIAHTIQQMINDRLIRTYRKFNEETGEWEEELLQWDEEPTDAG